MDRVETLALGGGRSLHTVMRGEGPDLVLIHGALTTGHDWLSGPADSLAVGHRLTVLDRPGHGLSRRPRFEASPREQAAQILSGLERLGIDRPVLVAHSFGALVALAFAERFPESVARLVLVAPLAFSEPRPLEHSLFAPRAAPVVGPLLSTLGAATVDAPLLRLAQHLMFSPEPVPERWQSAYPYQLVLDSASMVAEGEDAAAILPGSPLAAIDVAAIRIPADIVIGTRDRVVDNDRHGRRLARLMPHARLIEIEGAGHMLHHKHAALLAETVREALAAA
jgi:pimeloyl-ACP methyl ester carboxylesterase